MLQSRHEYGQRDFVTDKYTRPMEKLDATGDRVGYAVAANAWGEGAGSGTGKFRDRKSASESILL